MVQILFKIHTMGAKEVLAVCDQEVCGKTLRGNKVELNVIESFYKGKKITEQELKTKLHAFENINIVGNKAVGIAIGEKLASEDNVIEVAGVKHVQIFKI